MAVAIDTVQVGEQASGASFNIAVPNAGNYMLLLVAMAADIFSVEAAFNGDALLFLDANQNGPVRIEKRHL